MIKNYYVINITQIVFGDEGDDDVGSSLVGTAIPEVLMPPGVILAADPGGLGTMVLATSPVVYAGAYFPANRMDESELFTAVMTVT